ncbi:pilus assembly protein CpaD [Pseudohoeflea suaedae]|uniref:Pilus assembly protein CpaD n=1 Tax=Pseudohoeflea suaedae TaxID=877384 RepID=A0A4R5PLT9_9HYPH|nr:CpaD family pilus assembly lipoprotein [Pseudohoeflea suaedae]TDH37924.1 pilus assembly protein CpaD [Pseudohoeflea suaedae]
MNTQNSTYSLGALRRLAGPVAMASLAAVLLSGCANRQHVIVGSIPDDYRTRHPIIISEKEHTFDVPVSSSDRKLTQSMRETVRGASDRYHTMASGAVTVLVPTGSPNYGAASLIAREVVDILVSDSVPRHNIIMASYVAPSPEIDAPIRIAFTATTAATGPCGRWSEDMLANADQNRNYENFGCSSQHNLAAQIENPGDLLNPRGMTSIDAERRGAVVEAYRANGAALLGDD